MGYALDLGLGYASLAACLKDLGDAQGAIEWFERAFRVLDGVLKKEPHQVFARQFSNDAHKERAVALTTLGRYAEAELDWEQASHAFHDEPFRTRKAVWHALLLASRQQYAEAMTEARALEKVASTSADKLCLYWQARVHALVAKGLGVDSRSPMSAPTGEGETQVRRALALLESNRTLNKGDNEQMHKILQVDSAFDHLRKRADFIGFMQKLDKAREQKH